MIRHELCIETARVMNLELCSSDNSLKDELDGEEEGDGKKHMLIGKN